MSGGGGPSILGLFEGGFLHEVGFSLILFALSQLILLYILPLLDAFRPGSVWEIAQVKIRRQSAIRQRLSPSLEKMEVTVLPISKTSRSYHPSLTALTAGRFLLFLPGGGAKVRLRLHKRATHFHGREMVSQPKIYKLIRNYSIGREFARTSMQRRQLCLFNFPSTV